jgi:hypothetical protein
MKRTLPVPLITLIFGAALAVGLLIVNMLAARPKTPTAAAAATVPPASSTTASPSAPAATWPAQASYAGPAKSGGASVTVSVNGSKAVGLVCRGSVPTWLAGSTSGGRMTMTGTGGSSLSADYTEGKAAGSTTAGGTRYTFSAPRALTAGLYNSLRDHRTHCQGAGDNQGGGQGGGGGGGSGGGGGGGGGGN